MESFFTMDTLIAFVMASLMFFVPIILIAIIAMWRVFTKAGQPGWAILIPFYNLYVYTQILKRPGWWMLLYFASAIPVIGYIGVLFVSVIDSLRLAKLFGKPSAFGVGLVFLGFIFMSILAFGGSEYDESRVLEGELV